MTVVGTTVGLLAAAIGYALRDGGADTARRNAWQAMCEDRERARDRAEASHYLRAAVSR